MAFSLFLFFFFSLLPIFPFRRIRQTRVRSYTTQTEYVRNISDDAKENREIASFFSSVITNLFRLNDNLKETINDAKSLLATKKLPHNDRNAALLKRLMECAVDEDECNVHDNSACMVYSDIYQEGTLGIGYLTHISDVRNAICYILDVDRMPDPMLFYGKHLKSLNRLPETGEVFAYHLNQKFMFRAMRCATSDSEAIAAGRFQYYVKLIDIGSTIWIDTSNGFHNHYELDEMVQQIPGYAIKCQIIQMPTSYNLLNILHDKVSFRVLKMGNPWQHMYVELLSQSTNPFLCLEEVGGGNNIQLYSYFHWTDVAPFGESNGPTPSMLSSADRNESPLSNCSYASNNYSYASSSDGLNVVSNHFMEMFNTAAASKPEPTKALTLANWNIVHEHRMQQFADTLSSDDENINEHYDPAVISCVEAEPNVPKIQLPRIGDTIDIAATFVVDVERFYAYIPSCLGSSPMDVKQLKDEMNDENMCRNYQRLQLMPPINECVFALFQNFIYRARVISHYDTLNYKVYYIDYGNCAKVNLNELFKWDPRWENVPPQVFLCRLHGMRKIRFYDFEAMTALEGLLINKTLKAKVTKIIEADDNSSTIVLSVKDITGGDVTRAMCDRNFARPI